MPTPSGALLRRPRIWTPSSHRSVASVETERRDDLISALSHLIRTATPMPRYWSNDYARLSRERCSCGRTHVRAVAGILGRHDDLVVFKGAKFYPSQVEKVVRTFSEFSPEFRVDVQVGPDGSHVDTCVVVAEWSQGEVSGVAERLRHALRSELGVTPAVRVDAAGILPRTAFKAVRLVVVPRPSEANRAAGIRKRKKA